MRRSRQSLIDDLVGDLKPVDRPGRVKLTAGLWLSTAAIYSVVILLATGPLRPGALRDLAEYPGFAGETLLAVVAICTLAFAALRSAVPGAQRPLQPLLWSAVPLALWVGVYIVGLWLPVHPVSQLGSRDYCIWQTVLFSLPTFALMLWALRRQFPLWPRRTGMLAGAAAAAIPAELMQFGCMYVPRHILTHHLAPVFIMAVLGALLGPLVLRVRAAVPRRPDVSIH